MALIHCDFFSEALGMSTSICVILPQETRTQIGMKGSAKRNKYPVLYLLHGYSDDHTIWQRRTSIERYVSNLGLAVVMPNAGKSYYNDMKHGLKYWTYISEELPELCRSFFPLSEAREDNFAAGLSMGGYGAMRLVLTFPERFAAGATLSGALDIASRVERETLPHRKAEFYDMFGEVSDIKNSEQDLFYLVNKINTSASPKSKLYQCCGTEDFLYNDNIRFRDFVKSTSLELTYEEGPGQHEWGYWDRQIQSVLNWLPIKK